MLKPFARTTLSVTDLEARDTPAALASFNAVTGQLTVTIDNNVGTGQQAVLSESRGQVFLNGRAVIARGTTLASGAVRSIVVNGSGFDNYIDLGSVSTRGFRGLDGRVTINGGVGNDTIQGSQFTDVIRGGIGNDRLFGNGGNDALYGEAGNDNLYGGAGRDTLDGGADNDNLSGHGDGDTFIGGSGYDIAYDFSSQQGDRIGTGIEKVFGR